MSRSPLYVRLADGTVRYGLFNNTCDQAMAYLVDSINEAWDVYYPDHAECDDERKAQLRAISEHQWDHFGTGIGQSAVAYTEGTTWPTTATRTHITGPLSFVDENYHYIDGAVPRGVPEPSWAGDGRG